MTSCDERGRAIERKGKKRRIKNQLHLPLLLVPPLHSPYPLHRSRTDSHRAAQSSTRPAAGRPAATVGSLRKREPL
uniref:Uncharacterized protein n=1 Tax=Oryza brachyantha TaxID=4533 RepID=J3LT72_ORYBR